MPSSVSYRSKNIRPSTRSVALLTFALAATAAAAQSPPTEPAAEPAIEPAAASSNDPAAAPKKAPPPTRFDPPGGASRLSPEHRIWVDVEKKRIYMDGVVSLREGVLEMFACTRHTKEHESIVAVETKAFLAHAALLRIGAKPGKPYHFKDGDYFPPTGEEIEVTVEWLGDDGKMKSAPAQSWVRDLRTKKPMTLPWVFGGSGFFVDEATGTRHYQAESGDFICVSNFSTAMLDVPAESSQSNEGLLFEAFTERIPPLGTPVRLVLQPKAATE